ncbi:MAG: L,D-transpeptidase family protein [Pseudobdellovibrio sp.]
MKTKRLIPYVMTSILTMQAHAIISDSSNNVNGQPLQIQQMNINADSNIQVMQAQQPVAVIQASVNSEALNRLNQMISVLEHEGMQKEWYLSSSVSQQLMNMAQSQGESVVRNSVEQIVIRALRDLNRGYVTPDRLPSKTIVTPKEVSSKALQEAAQGFVSGRYSVHDVVGQFRPKNVNYVKLLKIYQKIVAMKEAGEIMSAPDKLSTVKKGATDAKSILYARQRLAMFGYDNNTSETTYTSDLEQAIRDLQENNLLKPDGVLGINTFGLLNTPVDQIISSLKINLDRSRWLPDVMAKDNEYVHVNLAAQRLFYYKDNVITLTFRTINGRVERQTPIMFDKINHMRINPTWTIPSTIMFKDKLPIFSSDPGKVSAMHMKLVSDVDGREIDPYSVNWSSLSQSYMPFSVVQKPGPWNALGFIKFPLLVNREAIYMHDTNDRHLFANSKRLMSSGCVRIEKPFELAEKLLSNKTDSSGYPIYSADTLRSMSEGLAVPPENDTKIDLGRTVPVYLLYETAQVNDHGQMTLVSDAYGVDAMTYRLMISGR